MAKTPAHKDAGARTKKPAKAPAKRKVVASSDGEHEEAHDHSDEEPQTRTAKKPRMEALTCKVDDDSENEESGEEMPVAKKGKAGKARTSHTASSEAQDQDVSVKVNEEGEKYIDLGKKRRATVRSFKGTVFLDVREFYGNDNDLKPGKKGISLQLEQWENLKNSADAIDQLFAKSKK
ncbi:transcriptional Coactivator p15-domain-containing protein [Amylocystis lapponica]|nr:transcriptional Coactivator p15-domain-containing protein [Amylocystis lapponica]